MQKHMPAPALLDELVSYSESHIEARKCYDEAESSVASGGQSGDCPDNANLFGEADIGPNDVLCGRGSRSNQNPGNAAFRDIVARFAFEYSSVRSHRAKKKIAAEIVNHVRKCVDPPGRFLAMVEKKTSSATSVNIEQWRQVDDTVAMEKAKQALRNHMRQKSTKQSHESTASKGGPNKGRSDQETAVQGKRQPKTHRYTPIESILQDNIASAEIDKSLSEDDLEEMIYGLLEPIDSAVAGEELGKSSEGNHAANAERERRLNKTLHSVVQDSSASDDIGNSLFLHAKELMDGPIERIDRLVDGKEPGESSSGGNHTTTASTLMPRVLSNNNGEVARKHILEYILLASQIAADIRECHETGVQFHASNVRTDASALTGDRIRSDLVALGRQLYICFSGIDCGGDEGDLEAITAASVEKLTFEEERRSKKGRAVTSSSYPLLRDLGYPVSLCILVSSLIQAKDPDVVNRYNTAEEVEEDLRLMTRHPDRYLFDADAGNPVGNLDFLEGTLYGRSEEVSLLMDAFNNTICSGATTDRKMVLISGYSGTGKSALVDQLLKPLADRKGHFIRGKFDEFGHVPPTSVIFSAFDDYCKDLLDGEPNALAQVQLAIRDALGSRVSVLTGLIPNLGKIAGVSTPCNNEMGGKEAFIRFLIHFRAFVQAIAWPSHPIVLFFDDLQWADEASLKLMSNLILDNENRSLLFVGCYRDNEVGPNHLLRHETQKLSLMGNKILSIEVGNIDRDDVNTWMADILRLSPRLTQTLASIVHAKTGGNPLFVAQFLRSLHDDNLLWYSARSRQWEWDEEAIDSKDLADNVVDLMRKKMLKLNHEVCQLLKVAACIGVRCEASTLKFLNEDDTTDDFAVTFLLDVAVNEGLLCRHGPSQYKFSHDQIQQAAYELIPLNDRKAFHLKLGRVLWRRASETEMDDIIFIVIDQLWRGSALISDHDEQISVAQLFLRAGKNSISSSAFSQGSLYLLQGAEFLGEGDWENHYDLCLDLHGRCAQALYSTGNYEGAMTILNPILKHGKCLQDKLSACYTLLNCLGSLGNISDVIEQGVELLMQLGESFPIEPTQNDIIKEYSKTRVMMDGITVEWLRERDVMKDAVKVAFMKYFSILVRYTYVAQKPVGLLIALRAVQLSIGHGVCRESSFAFACLGVVMCGFGDISEGYRCGKFALCLLDKFSAKDQLARVYSAFYSTASLFREPLQASVSQLKHGHKVGMSMGDVEWAMSNGQAYTVDAFACGHKLDKLEDEVRAYVQTMREYKHHMLLAVLPCFQTILNLMGFSEDPTDLTGEAMNQEELLGAALEKRHETAELQVYYLRMMLAVFFRRYDVAAEIVKHRRQRFGNLSRRFRGLIVVNETFYTGLVAVVMAKIDDQNEWRRISDDALEKMLGWAEQSAWNFQHKFLLLKAEIAFHLKGDVAGAAMSYDDAIKTAEEHGFLHEQALACERAGAFYSEALSVAVARKYFERAHKHYVEWGARRKVEDIVGVIDDLNNEVQ